MTPKRYRRTDWQAVKREMPPEIRRDCGWQSAPPGFVLVSFASETAQKWVDERIPSYPDAPSGVPYVSKADKQAHHDKRRVTREKR